MYKLFLLIFLFFFGTLESLGYENQGFLKYTENYEGINFECENQCFIIIGKKDTNNIFQINGYFNGNGILGYGFLNGQEIIPGEFENINNNSINKQFILNNLSYYSQLPDEIFGVLIIQGKVKSNNLKFNFSKSSFGENMKIGLSEFFKIEILTPYSINLRYGTKLFGTSIVKIGYIFILLIFLISLFFFRKNKDILLYCSIFIFLIIGYRNLYNFYKITTDGISNYSVKNYEEKSFFDLGDYITFTDKIRKILKLDDKNITHNCNLYIESYSYWPFSAHFKSVYLKPCKFTDDINKSNYLIYYKKEIPENIKGEILINFNNSFLIKK